MAQDNQKMSTGKTVVIVIFAVVLVASLCLPFFSSCSATPTTAGDDSASSDASSSSDAKTVSQVDADYQQKIDTLTSRLSANSMGSAGLAAIANLGNAYMDWGEALTQASDADDNDEHVKATFAQAVEYYDQYLEQEPDSNAVRVDRAICAYYAGDEDGAVSALESFVGDNPDFSPAWMNLGMFYEQSSRYDEALSAYSAAISADAKDPYNMSSYAQLRALIVNSIKAQASASSGADGSAASDGSRADGTAVSSLSRDASSSSDTAADEDGIAKPIVG